MDEQVSADFELVFAEFSTEIQALGKESRQLIYAVLPQTVEVIWTRQKTIGYGTGPKKMTEHFTWLAPAKKHLTFGFYYGAELPDPENILEGTGKLLRHVKIKTLDDLRNPALRQMLEYAIHYRVPAPKSLSKE